MDGLEKTIVDIINKIVLNKFDDIKFDIYTNQSMLPFTTPITNNDDDKTKIIKYFLNNIIELKRLYKAPILSNYGRRSKRRSNRRR